MKMIQKAHGLKSLALLGLGMSLAMPAISWAQPDANNVGKGDNPPNRQRRAKGQRNQRNLQAQNEKALARVREREIAAAEAVAGKPLTEEQKAKVTKALEAREKVMREAREAYIAELAASLGMEPDAVRLKMREANANRAGRAGRLDNPAGGRRNRGARDAAPAVNG